MSGWLSSSEPLTWQGETRLNLLQWSEVSRQTKTLPELGKDLFIFRASNNAPWEGTKLKRTGKISLVLKVGDR